MPQRSIAAAIASGPAVKFRFTGRLAGERRRDVGERAADRRGQQQADVRPGRPRAGESSATAAATGDERAAEGQRRPCRSRPCRTIPSGASRTDELAAEHFARAAAHRRRLRADAPSARRALPPPASTPAAGAPNATVTGYGNRAGHFQKKRAALEAEDAAPDAIEVDRHDRHVEAVDDPLEAALERQQVAGAADRAFREDADDVAVLQLLRARARSRATASRPPPTGIALQHLQQRVHRPVLVVRLVDEEADEPLDARADQRAVDVREVVADEQRGSARRARAPGPRCGSGRSCASAARDEKRTRNSGTTLST